MSGDRSVALPITVVSLMLTCASCPTQWEGHTADGRCVYIRYRRGWLSVNMSWEASDDVKDALNGAEIFSDRCGGKYDGLMKFDDLVAATRRVVNFTCAPA